MKFRAFQLLSRILSVISFPMLVACSSGSGSFPSVMMTDGCMQGVEKMSSQCCSSGSTTGNCASSALASAPQVKGALTGVAMAAATAADANSNATKFTSNAAKNQTGGAFSAATAGGSTPGSQKNSGNQSPPQAGGSSNGTISESGIGRPSSNTGSGSGMGSGYGSAASAANTSTDQNNPNDGSGMSGGAMAIGGVGRSLASLELQPSMEYYPGHKGATSGKPGSGSGMGSNSVSWSGSGPGVGSSDLTLGALQTEKEMNAMGTVDPEDYFTRVNLSDSIFKVVETQYRKKAMEWTSMILSPSSTSGQNGKILKH